MTVRDLMQPLLVSHAVVVSQPAWGDLRVYGRVEGHSGAECDGIRAIVHVRTPGGSLYRVGRAWVHPADDVDLAALKGYEFAHKETCQRRPLYDDSPIEDRP